MMSSRKAGAKERRDSNAFWFKSTSVLGDLSSQHSLSSLALPRFGRSQGLCDCSRIKSFKAFNFSYSLEPAMWNWNLWVRATRVTGGLHWVRWIGPLGCCQFCGEHTWVSTQGPGAAAVGQKIKRKHGKTQWKGNGADHRNSSSHTG